MGANDQPGSGGNRERFGADPALMAVNVAGVQIALHASQQAQDLSLSVDYRTGGGSIAPLVDGLGHLEVAHAGGGCELLVARRRRARAAHDCELSMGSR